MYCIVLVLLGKIQRFNHKVNIDLAGNVIGEAEDPTNNNLLRQSFIHQPQT